MASTYVNNLRLNEMATGDASGTWGTNTNTNLELIGQALGYGTRAIANASTDNITIADGASDSDRAMYLKLTGGGQACTVTLLPNTASKVWMMENATSYTLTFTQGSGANVAILAGETKIIATDGAGSAAVVYDVLTDTNLAGHTKVDDLTIGDDLVVGGDIDLEGAIDVNGTANLDVVDIDGAVDMASTLQVDGVATFTGRDIHSGGITIGNAGQIGSVGTVGAIAIASDGVVTFSAGLTMSGGTANIDGATQADGTITVGVDDTGHDVKFHGATASAYMLWDESADDLILAGAARVVVPDSGLVLGSTAVTATGTELNYVDGVTSAIQTQIDTKTSTGKAIAMAIVFG